MNDAGEVLCQLEKVFPLTFTDVMSHLMIQIVEELYICGPMHYRCVYPVERYLKTLKDYMQTYARLEAIMVEGYAMSETLGYCTKYMQHFQRNACQVWNDKEDSRMNNKIVQGNGWSRPML
jgi:hypothetical protein